MFLFSLLTKIKKSVDTHEQLVPADAKQHEELAQVEKDRVDFDRERDQRVCDVLVRADGDAECKHDLKQGGTSDTNNTP